MRARWRAASIVALLAVLLTTVGTASAARLPIAGATLTTLPQVTRCTHEIEVEPGAVRQNGTSTTVVVRGLTSRCAGARVDLTIVDASGAVVRRVSGSVPTSGPATVTLGATAFAPAQNHRVFATVGTWGVPARWTYAPPMPALACEVRSLATHAALPGYTCRTDELVVTHWGSGAGGNLQLNFNAYASAEPGNTAYIAFSLRAPAQDVPNGWSWAKADIAGGNVAVGDGRVTSRCSELPVITGRAASNMGAKVNFYLHLVQGGSRGICQPG